MASSNGQGLLQGARVYLSGPMDFVASREAERKGGWRNRVGEFLRQRGVTVFDPWDKPEVKGILQYGREDEKTARTRDNWTFEPGEVGAARRAECAGAFWPAMHIDLRMVDTSDFIIAYCPTNVYSVGTPHEIILARQQRKPVLFVSPKVRFPALDKLREHFQSMEDARGAKLLEDLLGEVPIKENHQGAPSLWYMPLIGSECFFDGFGFNAFRDRFDWPEGEIDLREHGDPPVRPLLTFLEQLNSRLPTKWNRHLKRFDADDDWLLWDLKEKGDGFGAQVRDAFRSSEDKEPGSSPPGGNG